MSIKFFGDFLVERGKLSYDQLKEVLLYQKRNNLSLGKLAVNKGYLTDAQVLEINQRQRVLDKKFGEIALSRKLLNEDQIKLLLKEQQEKNLHFGDIVLNKKFISKDELDTELDYFENMQNDSVDHIHKEVAFCDRDNLMQDSILLFEHLYYRVLHNHIKFEQIDLLEPQTKEATLISQSLNGDESIAYALFIENKTSIMEKEREGSDKTILENLTGFLDVFLNHMVNYLFSRGMTVSTTGHKLIDTDLFYRTSVKNKYEYSFYNHITFGAYLGYSGIIPVFNQSIPTILLGLGTQVYLYHYSIKHNGAPMFQAIAELMFNYFLFKKIYGDIFYGEIVAGVQAGLKI